MALQAALGTALSWAKGPVPQTRAAWTRACELADVLLDKEVQLQAHYGLWLYHLRCGQYSESLAHATEMMNLSRSAGDFEGLAANHLPERLSLKKFHRDERSAIDFVNFIFFIHGLISFSACEQKQEKCLGTI